MTARAQVLLLAAKLRGAFPELQQRGTPEVVALLFECFERNCLAFMRRNNRVTGVALVRLLAHREDWQTPGLHDPTGTVLWVEWVFADTFVERNLLIAEALRRFPQIVTVGFERGQRTKRGHTARFYPVTILNKLYGILQRTNHSYRQAA